MFLTCQLRTVPLRWPLDHENSTKHIPLDWGKLVPRIIFNHSSGPTHWEWRDGGNTRYPREFDTKTWVRGVQYSRVARKLRLVLEGPKLELIYLWVRVPRVSCAWESPAGFKSVSKCRKLHE